MYACIYIFIYIYIYIYVYTQRDPTPKVRFDKLTRSKLQ